MLNAANEVAVQAFLAASCRSPASPRVIESTLAELPAQPVRHFTDLYEADAAGARGRRGGVRRVSWFLAFAGFAVLVILHELGHFTAAKAVGMRVEKFSLFFPPTLLSKKVGETEYAIGSIPRGRLREDQRDEPVGGPARGGSRPGLPRPAGLEADRGDRRRARR